jgi:hypothetical protein
MRRICITVGIVWSVLAGSLAFAQQNLPPLPQPRLQSLFPGGAQVGTSVEVTFTGTDIEEPDALYFSHPGLKAEPIQPPEPPPDPKKPAPTRKQGMRAKTVVTKFKVTVAPGTPLGLHDVRLVNKWGISNPRPFAVGDLPELEEKEPNNDDNQAQRVYVNSVVNGIINGPTDVDYFSFSGKKDQRVVMHVAASSLDSRAKPEIQIFDSQGGQLVINRNYRGSDALADLTLPADGNYLIRLCEFTYTAGSNDYYYRLTITTGPWIDAVIPPMIEPGKTAQVTVYGRNLPGGQKDSAAVADDGCVLEKVQATITAPSDPTAQQRLAYSGHIDSKASDLDGFEYRIKGASGWSNPYLIMFARSPVIVEKEPNDKPESAQVVNAPCEIAGQLNNRGDRDWYAFNAKKGDVYSIELIGDRIGSPAHFYFSLKPSEPKASPIGEFEDNQETLSPFQFYTRNSDPPVYRFDVKKDGQYLIRVGALDSSNEFGPRHLYRLRIAPEQPDFRLIVMGDSPQLPDAGVLHADGTLTCDVFIWRRDGFNAPITLTAEGLPAGVSCPPQLIAPTQKQATLVFTAAANAAPTVASIKVKGTADLNGQKIVREARPASISWAEPQPNVPTISRIDREFLIAVREKPPYRFTVKETALTVKLGEKAPLNFKVERLWPDFKGPIQVRATHGPQQNQPLIPGLQFNNNQPVTIAADKSEGTGTLNVSNNAQPGVYSFVLRADAQHQFEKVPKGPKVNTGLSYPALPVTLTVIPATLASVSASVGNVKIGGAGEITVKVSRKYNYAGEFKLKLILPAGVAGINVAEAVIPAGKDEIKVPLKIAPDAKPGNVANVVVQATGMFDGKTAISSETKFNLNLVK